MDNQLIAKKIISLRRPIWTARDVKNFVRCGNSTAYKLIEKCRVRFGGAADEEHSVLRDKFLEMFSTTYKQEIENAYIELEALKKAENPKG